MTQEEEPQLLRTTISEFYSGCDVLVTGGSGFVGRVLLERLLRCCPDIGTIFVLVRTRKGLGPEERLKKFTDVALFDRVRAERPGALEKLRAVSGDVTQRGLGLSDADARDLTHRVSVVFHLAASVRFDDPLHVAVRINTRSIRELLELATRMTRLKVFMHVSTTFCNVGQEVYEEKMYPPLADWRSFVAIVDALDDVPADAAADVLLRLHALTRKILGQHVNTYTFTKKLAEDILQDYADRLPLGIVRPSVVIATARQPIPGWVDNFYGPMGMLVGAGKGLVHTSYGDPDGHVDFIPCDMVVSGLLISSLEVAEKGIGSVSVYQGAQSEMQRITAKQLLDIAYDVGAKLPFKQTLYHPCGGTTKYSLQYYLQFLFFHLLPAMIVDTGIYLTGRRPFLVRLQRRIYAANRALSYFMLRNWNFVNARFRGLEFKVLECDKENFLYDMDNVVPHEFFTASVHGVRKYLLFESDEDLPEARRRYWRKFLLHKALKTMYYVGITWFVLSRIYYFLFEYTT